MVKKHLALATAAFVILPSGPSFAQLSPQQILQNMVLNVRNPRLVSPQDVSSTFRLTIQHAPAPQSPPPAIDQTAGVDPNLERQEMLQRPEQQRQEQQEVQRRAKERQAVKLVNTIRQVMQQKQELNQANHQAAQQRKQNALDRFMDSLSQQQRQSLQQRIESAAFEQEQTIEFMYPEPQPVPDPEPSWLDEYRFYRDGIAAGPRPDDLTNWDNFGVAFNGSAKGVAGDGAPVSGGVHLRVMIGEGMSGQIDFDDAGGTVYFQSAFDGSDQFTLQTGVLGTFFGGQVEPGQDGLAGGFYGPEWQNAGGTWAFTVTGGDKPGEASGEFAASR